MTSQDGHGIVTKLKIMRTFGLIWPNWLKMCLLLSHNSNYIKRNNKRTGRQMKEL